jgi:hypothetical protein
MKALSIIAIIIFAFSFLCICAFQNTDVTSAIGWGVIASVFGVAYAITALVKSCKK